MPVLKVYKNGAWEDVSGVSGHTRTKDEITDFPSSIPANGGNADMLDGKHANEFAAASDIAALQSKVGNESVATQIENALVDKADKTNGIYFIVGNSTTAGTWTGTSDDITEYYDGLTIAYLTNVAGISDGSTLNINGLGAKNVRRNVSNVTTNYAANSLIHLTYVTIDGTGYWQMADYDSNTKTTAGSSNKTGAKMYLIGGTSQSSSGVTTYSNKNVYIGTDNCLYSNGTKVATSADIPTDDHINTLIDAKLGVIENGTY